MNHFPWLKSTLHAKATCGPAAFGAKNLLAVQSARAHFECGNQNFFGAKYERWKPLIDQCRWFELFSLIRYQGDCTLRHRYSVPRSLRVQEHTEDKECLGVRFLWPGYYCMIDSARDGKLGHWKGRKDSVVLRWGGLLFPGYIHSVQHQWFLLFLLNLCFVVSTWRAFGVLKVAHVCVVPGTEQRASHGRIQVIRGDPCLSNESLSKRQVWSEYNLRQRPAWKSQFSVSYTKAQDEMISS